MPDTTLNRIKISCAKHKRFLYKIYLFFVSISLALLVFDDFNSLTLFQDLTSPKKAYLIFQCLAPICLMAIFIKSKIQFTLSVLYLATTYLLYRLSPYDIPIYYGIAVISVAISQCKASFVIKTATIILFIAIITCFTLYLLELIDNEFFALRDNKLRNAFGFRHPNGLGAILLAFALGFWCCFKGKLTNYLTILLLSAVAFFIYNFVDSRTSGAVCVLAIILISVYILVMLIGHKSVYNILIKTAFIICISSFTVLSFAELTLAYNFDPGIEFYKNLNDILSTRLNLAHNGIENIRISLYGQILQLSDTNPLAFDSHNAVSYQYLDSLYIMIPVVQGIFCHILLNILYVIVVYRAFKSGNHRIGITLFLFSVYSLSESNFVLIAFNIYIYLVLCKFDNCNESSEDRSKSQNCES